MGGWVTDNTEHAKAILIIKVIKVNNNWKQVSYSLLKLIYLFAFRKRGKRGVQRARALTSRYY